MPQLLLNYAVIPETVVSEDLVVALKVIEVNLFPVTFLLTYLITNSIHVWLTEDYRLSGMGHVHSETI